MNARWSVQIFFIFTPENLGKISNLPNIFQMGGSTTNQHAFGGFISGSFAHRMSRWMADAMDFYQQVGRCEG